MSNIQKLFYERIEVFGAVEFSKLSIVTGIVKIALKVLTTVMPPHNVQMPECLLLHAVLFSSYPTGTG